jgi:glycosyltransferase involved in cell wall biosynthesis
MLKIKYWGSIFDGSGYGSCSRHYIKALIECGAELTLSPVSFEQERPDLGELGNYLSKYINKPIDYDVNLIHLTPEHYPLYREEEKINVGYTVWETDKIHHDWVGYCNCMDAILVACEWNVEVFRNSGVTVPIYCVPHVIDTTQFNGVDKFVMDGPKEDDYIFYSIFQFNEKKDPVSLLKAYWHAFNSEDNVALVLKVYRYGHSEKEQNIVIQTIKKIKESMIMPKGKDYARVYLILTVLSDKEILELHKLGDCFVSLNRGEGFGLPIAEASAAGNPSIVTGYGGVNQFLNKGNSYLIDYVLTPVSGMVNTPWYLSDQCWAQANVKQAAEVMKHVYKYRNETDETGLLAQKYVTENFNYQVIGKLYINILNKIVKDNI